MTLVTISSKNQITIPVDYLRALDLKPGERFLIDKRDEKLVFEPVRGSIIDELAGSLEKFIPVNKKRIPIDEAIKRAKIMHARKVTANK